MIGFVYKVTKEIETYGDVIHHLYYPMKNKTYKLNADNILILLLLGAENTRRSNLDYINKLFLMTGRVVSSSTITIFSNTSSNTKGDSDLQILSQSITSNKQTSYASRSSLIN